MFKNFLISAFRNIRREGIVSGISITGMAFGLSVSLLILMYVFKEFSYDQFSASDRIYRLELKQISDQSPKWAISHHATVKDIQVRSSQIEEVMFFKKKFQVTRVKAGDQDFFEKVVAISNEAFVEFTDLKIQNGSAEGMLGSPYQAILSQEYAKRYFNDTDPVGQLIEVDTASYLVTGVFRTTKPTHLSADVVVSEPESADLRWLFTYLKLKEGADVSEVLEEINGKAPELEGVFYNDTEYDLINIGDIHFESTSKFQLGTKGNRETVYVLLGIGLLILTIACINFINLTSAVFVKVSKEAAIRKVLGSSKGQLFQRYFIQSGILLGLSILIGTLFFVVVAPIANNTLGLNMRPSEFSYQWVLYLIVLLGLVFFVTNILPAIRSSQLDKPDDVNHKRSGMHFLMVFQFCIAIILIVGTFLVRDQMDYLHNRYLGYGDDALLFVQMDDQSLWAKSTEYRKRFEGHPSVLYTSSIMGAPGDPSMMGNQNAWAEGMALGENVFLPLYAGEEEIVETLGLTVINGHGFEFGVNASDTVSAILVNETAAKEFGWDDPIGKRMRISGNECRVVGVVEDFHFLDLHEPIGPLVIAYSQNNYNIAVRINRNGLASALEFIEKQWEGIDPVHPFNSFFLEENFERQYQSEDRLKQVLNVLTALALIICSIGILGMVLMIMDQRTKEIGIRKVLGANIVQILTLLNKNVFILVVISNLIAWPLAYLLGKNWLQSFAYRTELNVMIFLIAGIIVCVLVLITVSYHSIKSALRNPVETLKYE